jgi:hypothetical protein
MDQADDISLQSELLRRAPQDQAARDAFQAGAAWDAVATVDRANTAWLRDIVAVGGWPTADKAGQDGANAAWLLVQHADEDPDFQRQCLVLMSSASVDVSPREIAYLTDRVLVAEGRPQRYGTQMHGVGGRWVPRPLENEDQVDRLRAEVGFEPLAATLAAFNAENAPPQMYTTCQQCGGQARGPLPAAGETVVVTCGGCGMQTSVTRGD